MSISSSDSNTVTDCVGTINGTHIPCTSIGVQNPTAYRNRKVVNSKNIMAVYSFSMKFTYILSSWEGSTHDVRVLADAVGTCKFKFPHPPPDYFGSIKNYRVELRDKRMILTAVGHRNQLASSLSCSYKLTVTLLIAFT